nr:M28 family peptidase [Clostridium coskatii]
MVICAHYDCERNSVGANDNASGVSVVMETARLLKNVSSEYELRFVFFGGEEIGGLGSRHYIKNLSPDDKKNN